MAARMSGTTARVLKALSVFGGVQVITIICSVVRTKLVALLIGPVGVGLITLYFNTMEMLQSTTQLNLRQSAVRDISVDADNASRLAVTVAVTRRLALLLGLAGMVLVIVASPLLSRWTFGDGSHTWAFIVLSPILLFAAYGAGEGAVMQGMNRLAPLARATLWAAVASTVVSIPLYYFFRLDGIVPVLFLFSLANALCFFFLRERSITAPRIGFREALRRGRPMLSLGMYMTVSSAATLLSTYIFSVWLNEHHSTATVGIYHAGTTLVTSYVGLIFTAISMEYYPRLSASVHSKRRTEVVVSHEIMIAASILMPVVVGFICCSPLVVKILYSSAFEAVLPYIAFSLLGVFLRASSWCMAFVVLARGDGRIFVATEVASAVIFLAVQIPMFSTWGYMGAGIGYVIWYALYQAVVWAFYRYRYGMRLRRGIATLTLSGMAVGALTIALCAFIGRWWTLALVLPPTAIFAVRKVLRR